MNDLLGQAVHARECRCLACHGGVVRQVVACPSYLGQILAEACLLEAVARPPADLHLLESAERGCCFQLSPPLEVVAVVHFPSLIPLGVVVVGLRSLRLEVAVVFVLWASLEELLAPQASACLCDVDAVDPYFLLSVFGCDFC